MTVLDPIVTSRAAPALPGREEPAAGAPPRRWRWTGDDLIRLGEAGLLPLEARFELLDGEVYQLMPPGPLHAFLVGLLRRILQETLGELAAHVREEKPLRLDDQYDPQPDLAVVRGADREYRERFPGPADTLQVIEVADSSLEHDRTLKLPAYAAAGIPECWIVNLPDRQVEVYRAPAAGEYQERRILRAGESAAPLWAPGILLAVATLLSEPGSPA